MGINLPKLLAKNLTKFGGPIGVKSCTLVKVTPGIRTPGAITGGTNTTTASYAAKGWIESYDSNDMIGTTITEQDRKISVLGASIAGGAVPMPGDRITISDPNGVARTYDVQAPVKTDAVGAVYILQGRF